MAERVVAIRARPSGSAFRADHGDRNPVTVGDAGDDKLAPIAERAGAKVGDGHAADDDRAGAGGNWQCSQGVKPPARLVGHWRDTRRRKNGNRRENTGTANPMMR